MSDGDWVTPKQAAGMLGFQSTTSVYRFIEEGLLRSNQPRGPWGRHRLRRSDVEALANRGLQESA